MDAATDFGWAASELAMPCSFPSGGQDPSSVLYLKWAQGRLDSCPGATSVILVVAL